jgi:hypothetical protein
MKTGPRTKTLRGKKSGMREERVKRASGQPKYFAYQLYKHKPEEGYHTPVPIPAIYYVNNE